MFVYFLRGCMTTSLCRLNQSVPKFFLQSASTSICVRFFLLSTGKWHGSDLEQTTGKEHSSAQLLLMAPGKTQPHIQLAQWSYLDAHLQFSQCFSSSACTFIIALFSCSILFPYRLPFNLHNVIFCPKGARHLLCSFDPFQHIF